MAELQRLARVDRKCEVRMLVYLAEVDARKLHLARGYSSLFGYAKATLRMSEAQTYLRIQAARVARTYPVVLDMLEQGALNLSTLKLLAPHLTSANHIALLERARDKSKRDVELLVAEIAPLPDVPTRLRKLPAARPRSCEPRRPSAEHATSLATATNNATRTEAGNKQPSSASEPRQSAPMAWTSDAPQPALPTFAAHATHHPTAALASETSQTTSNASTSHAPQPAHPTFAAHATHHATAALASEPAQIASDASTSHAPQPAHLNFALHATHHPTAALASEPAQIASNASTSHAFQRAQATVGANASQGAPLVFALEAPRAFCKPLRPGRFKLELTASQELHDRLMQLQHLLRHQVPNGDLAVIVERALKELLAKTLKRRFARVSKPRSSAEASTRERGEGMAVGGGGVDDSARSKASLQRSAVAVRAGSIAKVSGPEKTRGKSRGRYVPRAVVRAVSERDGMQCTFVSSDGQRCSEHGMLELHHVHAFARGGASDVENLSWVCRAHNELFAVRDFGAAHMRAMQLSAAERRSSEEQRP